MNKLINNTNKFKHSGSDIEIKRIQNLTIKFKRKTDNRGSCKTPHIWIAT